ncbi:MAG: DUF4190 domain-containing protein [Firmicutes bacterium]|nr:DUF4190 domain-containing protein [Bacillota bacterium]
MDNLENKVDGDVLESEEVSEETLEETLEDDFEAEYQPTWEELKERRTAKKKDASSPNSDAILGLIVGVVAIIAAVFGLAISFLPLVIGLYLSMSARKGKKRNLAIAGIVLNVIGLLLWAYAVFGRGLIG